MKKCLAVAVLGSFLLTSCAVQPACNTKAGKKKLKYYNSIQYQKAYKAKKLRRSG
jgi:hypothetical protein